jgi:hypothetical protein
VQQNLNFLVVDDYLADEIVNAVSSYEDSARELRGTSAALADVLEIADMLSMCKDSPELIRTPRSTAKPPCTSASMPTSARR